LKIQNNSFPDSFFISEIDLSDGELHVDTAEDDVGPGLAVEGGLSLIVTLDDSLDTTKLRESPLHVLEVDLTSSQRAATMPGSNGCIGIAEVGESCVSKNWGLGSTDSRGEVLRVADLVDAKNVEEVQFVNWFFRECTREFIE